MALSSEELAVLRQRLAAYQACELRILDNQSYEMDGRKLTRTDLARVQKAIDSLRAEIAAATGNPLSRGRVRRGVAVLR